LLYYDPYGLCWGSTAADAYQGFARGIADKSTSPLAIFGANLLGDWADQLRLGEGAAEGNPWADLGRAAAILGSINPSGKAAAGAGSQMAKVAKGLGGNAPSWVKNAGSFVNWMKNIQKEGSVLSPSQLDEIAEMARQHGVKIRADPPHPGTPWNTPHFNIGKEGQAHIPFPPDYVPPSWCPRGSGPNAK